MLESISGPGAPVIGAVLEDLDETSQGGVPGTGCGLTLDGWASGWESVGEGSELVALSADVAADAA